jgi:hypothetical protein
MRVLDKDGDYCLSETEFENLAEKIIALFARNKK